MPDDGAALQQTIFIKLRCTCLVHHFINSRNGELTVILRMRVQTCIVAAVILVIRQIDVNVTIEQLQRFHLLISAGIVYNRKRKPLFSGNLQRFDNLRHIMGAGNKVDVMRTFFLQREKGFRQCICHNVLSLGLSAADLPVLAGMRRSELCGLRHSKVDFENKKILVDVARVQINTGFIEKLPKGDKTRTTCICEVLEKFMQLALEQQLEWSQGKTLECGEYVYLTKTNIVSDYLPHPGKVSRRFKELQKRINKRLEKAGQEPLPVIRLHDLRHSFISVLLNSGQVNPFQVYGCAGHVIEDNTSTKTYWHDQGDRQEIIDFWNKSLTVDFDILK